MKKHSTGKWKAITGNSPELLHQGERAMFPHVLIPSKHGKPEKLVINCGGWGLKTHDANARLIAAAPDGLRAAELAYLHILKTPYDLLRLKGQETLCALRDFIAEATGRTSEEVQNDFESMIALENDIAKAEERE